MLPSANRRAVGLVVLAVAVGRLAAAATPEEASFFESRVRPLLVTKCQECHGGKIAEAGLRLDSRPALLAGGDSGAVAIAGDAGHSRIIAAVKRAGDLAMPPDEPLLAEEVAVLEAWVAQGMPWSGPGDGGPTSRYGVAASGIACFALGLPATHAA